jgi:DNA repair exonuclease SbcCD ATPase subunit
MITHLSYHVRFKQTGRVLAQSIDFGQGMTAIIGPNEAGKSFVVEMIRYAFFGSAALRGVADDYDELKVKLVWKDIEIERTPKGGKVKRGGDTLAVGTKSMNAKVIELLGFGLDVFDVGIVCNQGDVERLGAMKPAERKAMIDRVIGASRIEEVQKWAGEQQSLLVREVAVLERGMVEPVAPVKPERYQDTAELAAEVARLRGLKTERDELVGWLSHTRVEPAYPPLLDYPPERVILEELDDARWYEGEVKRISALTVVDFHVEAVSQHWVDYVLWKQKGEFEQRHPRPSITEDGYTAELELRRHKDLWEELSAKSARLTLHPVECPHCHGSFQLEHGELAKIDAELAGIGKPGREPSSKTWVADQRRRLDDWTHKDTVATWERLKDAVETTQPVVTQAQLAAAQRGGHISSTDRDEMLAVLRKPRRSVAEAEKLLDGLRRYQLSKEAYAKEKAAYDVWLAERVVKEARLKPLFRVEAALGENETLLRACETYDRDLATFMATKADYDARQAELDLKRAEVMGWKDARTSLGEIRTRIKTYLVPSLSKVASSLLNQMTAGQRSSIQVDEDFDVLVDGQRLETLSGSGKAVANLALRIALGQVLTNKVVSLFVGDEIDASMDPERAEATHSSIRSLRGQILQIILITHKIPEADTTITLGTTTYGYAAAAEAA